jgi:GNAT superfamily N-acetyltransferase
VSFTLTRADGLTLSDDPVQIDLGTCMRWLASSYWASDRTAEQVERAFAGSRVFGVYSDQPHRCGPHSSLAPSSLSNRGSQVALARAVTDGATFCWLGDVFVDESVRGRGIGTWLVGSIVDQLRAEGVNRFLLGTRDAHGVYAKLGFIPLRVPEVFMELDERPGRPTRENVDPAVLSANSQS